jgi:hypothetical protein
MSAHQRGLIENTVWERCFRDGSLDPGCCLQLECSCQSNTRIVTRASFLYLKKCYLNR